MKQRLFLYAGLLLALLSVGGCGGGGGGSNGGGGTSTPVATPTPTAVGVPAGNAVSATIGAAGGSVSTPDGKIVLTIPAGALAADTVIGIQPLTNMAHGKIGAAFRLTPDGQQFLTPATLTFAYTDQDLQGTAIEALGGAFQTAAGFWQWAGDATVDTAAQTVSVRSTHFSDWSLVRGAQIRPPSAAVKVGESVALRVAVCYPEIDGELFLGYNCDTDDLSILNTVSEWSVNGVLGGSNATGFVNITSDVGSTATYTAPATRPSPNTVAVSARVSRGTRGTTLVVSNITIVSDFWIGTSSVLLVGAYSTDASVTWRADPTFLGALGEVRYVATGEVSVRHIGWNNVGCTASPTRFVLDPADGDLVVDYSVNPPSFTGGGVIIRMVSVSCPGQNTIQQGESYFFFSGTGSVTANGTTIAGSQTETTPSGEIRISYNFTRQ